MGFESSGWCVKRHHEGLRVVKWLRTIEAPEHIEGQLRGLEN